MFVWVRSDRCMSEEATCHRPVFIHEKERDWQWAYNVTLKCVHVTIVTVGKR